MADKTSLNQRERPRAASTRSLRDKTANQRTQDPGGPGGGGEELRNLTRLDMPLIRLGADGAAIAIVLSLARFLRFDLGLFEVTEARTLDWDSHLTVSLLWVTLFLALAGINRLYDEDTLFPGGGEGARVLRTSIETVALISLFVFFTHTFAVSRSWLALVLVLTPIFIVGERLLIRFLFARLRRKDSFRRPIILVTRDGSPGDGMFLQDVPEFKISLVVDYDRMMRHLREKGAQSVLARRQYPMGSSAIVVHSSEFNDDELWELLLNAGQSGFDVLLHSQVRSVGRDRLTLREVGGHTVVKVTPPKFSGLQAVEKRAFDLAVSVVALVVLSPVLIVTALAVLITSGRPIFYGQERTGKDGRPFTMWKFRSMRPDAESSTGAVWASAGDERRTPIGRFLRRTSIDELPQLWNVVVGDMSIVGPRPERPVFVDQFSTELVWYEYRHRIRPGITGLAQARGLRGNTSLQSRVESDNRYIEHWSLALDLSIAIRTVVEVFRGDNAY